MFHHHHEDRWSKMLRAGKAAMSAGKFKDAKKKCEDSANYAKKHLDIHEYAFSLLALSDAQRMLNLHDETEATLNKAINALLSHPEYDEGLYAIALGALGWLYLTKMKTEKAVTFFETATKIFRRIESKADKECLPVFIGLIACYLELKEFEKLEKSGQYACELSRELVGPTDATTFLLLTMRKVAAEISGKTLIADVLDAELVAVANSPEELLTDQLDFGEFMLKSLLSK